jgi:NAD(P)-dependent dehydrogenase (short-subunit alcohol dehydrogenase family)
MTLSTDFTGKVALVTGAGSGMGRATALAFSMAGASVVGADIDEASAHETVSLIEKQGGTAAAVGADVSDGDAVESLVRQCVDQFGALDCAVNNAAIEIAGARMADFDDADFDRLMAVNVKGVYLCLKYEIRQMLRQGGGTIVNIASINSFRTRVGSSVYSASKQAVIGLTTSAAIEYGADGIRVNAVAPGAIDTPMLRSALARSNREPTETARRMSPLGRFGDSDEVARAVLWLCSPMSSFTTGHTMLVDGGHLAG